MICRQPRPLLSRQGDQPHVGIVQGTVESYPGNFSAYWRQKAERLVVQRRTYEKQQMKSQGRGLHPPQPLRRTRAQAEDRRKKLERIERRAAAAARSPSRR